MRLIRIAKATHDLTHIVVVLILAWMFWERGPLFLAVLTSAIAALFIVRLQWIVASREWVEAFDFNETVDYGIRVVWPLIGVVLPLMGYPFVPAASVPVFALLSLAAAATIAFAHRARRALEAGR